MRALTGSDATVYFANLSVSSASALADDLNAPTADSLSNSSLAKFSATHLGVLALMKEQKIPIEKVCLLDPRAVSELAPEDGDGQFEWFLFGVSINFLRTESRTAMTAA